MISLWIAIQCNTQWSNKFKVLMICQNLIQGFKYMYQFSFAVKVGNKTLSICWSRCEQEAEIEPNPTTACLRLSCIAIHVSDYTDDIWFQLMT